MAFRTPSAAVLLALVLAPAASTRSGAQSLFDAVAKSRELQQSPGAKAPDFVCVNDPRGGLRCSGMLPGNAYPNKVTFFTAAAQPPKDAEIILYLHGQGACDKWLNNSPFGELLRQSGRTDSILVIPCGQDPWTRDDSAGFQRFWSGVAREAGLLSGQDAPSIPRALLLAGHSHAGYGLARILNFAAAGSYPPIHELVLFDCSFSDDAADRSYETYAAFGAAPGNRLLSVIRVAPDNKKIMAQMDARAAPYALLDADAVLAGSARPPDSGAAFMTSAGAGVVHDNIMNLFFPILLARP
jgi:hypothetical protein